MDTNTSTGNSETRSSGLGFTRLMLGRSFDSSKITVDKTTVINTPTSPIVKESSTGNAGPLTRTLHQIGKLFNSGITGATSASVVSDRGVTTTQAINIRGQRESWDTLTPMDESFSRRGSFGRTYSFTRCASFSHSNSFTKPSHI